MAKLKSLARRVKPLPFGASIILNTATPAPRGRVAAAMRERHPQAFAALVAECERLIREPIPERPYALFNRYRVDGNRTEYEKPYRQIHLEGLPTLSSGALLTGRDDILARLQDYLWEVCNYDPWAFPAHVPARLDPEIPVVDLFAAITAEHIGEALDLLADRLPDEIVARCRHEVRLRVLDPMVEHPMQFSWASRVNNNWSAVCFGAVGCAAVLTRLEHKDLAPLLDTCRDGMAKYLELLSRDDGADEGVSYWRFAMIHAARFADVLDRVTRGKECLFKWPAFRRAGNFPVQCYLPPDRYANFSDCTAVAMGRELLHLLMRHGDHAAEMAWLLEQPVEAAASVIAGSNRSIRAWLPSKRRVTPRPPKETVTVLREIDWAVLRESWTDPRAAVLAVKGGHNGESHNQIDVGHYIYHVFGESFVHDLGRGTYTKQYFSGSRYDNVFCNAEGHNSIFIAGVGPGTGGQCRAKMGKVKAKSGLRQVKLDLTALYPEGTADRVTRKFEFIHETSPHSLRVTDVIKGEVAGPIEVRVHVGVPMEMAGRGARLTGKSGAVQVNVLTEEATVEAGCFEGLAGDVARADYLRIVVRPSGDETRIAYEFVPASR